MNTFYLYPGKWAAFQEETIISTLLGSCVAVAIYDPSTGVGGLNHYLLASSNSQDVKSGRYADFAIPTLINDVIRLGGVKSKLQAKIYGGANVVSNLAEGIGSGNILAAERILKEYNIQIVEKNVGGQLARTIKLNTKTFQVQHNINSNSSDGADTPIDVSGFKALRNVGPVKVLIVDDSMTVRSLFTSIFTKCGLEVVGAAADPYQARDLIAKKKPDVITLDIEMPRMSGVQFLEKLMKFSPIPVVMVSSLGSQGEAALKSLELGAIEFVHKPSQFDPTLLKGLAEQLVDKVRAAASVNIVKKAKEIQEQATVMPIPVASNVTRSFQELKVIVVGGNVGSPESIAQLLSGLAIDTPPVVVSCSTVTGFVDAFLKKIQPRCQMRLMVAKNNEHLRAGNVYFIPAEHHGKFEMGGLSPVLKLEKSAPVNAQLPSANVLFKSAAEAYKSSTYGILLSGFGIDGVEGLTKIQDLGGVTVVQHPAEAAFPFGPQKAIENGVADHILKADEIAKQVYQYRSQRAA